MFVNQNDSGRFSQTTWRWQVRKWVSNHVLLFTELKTMNWSKQLATMGFSCMLTSIRHLSVKSPSETNRVYSAAADVRSWLIPNKSMGFYGIICVSIVLGMVTWIGFNFQVGLSSSQRRVACFMPVMRVHSELLGACFMLEWFGVTQLS